MQNRFSSPIYAANIEAGKQYHPYLDITEHAFPNQESFQNRVNIANSSAGVPNFDYTDSFGNRRLFHDLRNPLTEACAWADGQTIEPGSLLVFLGVGFFYHIAELLHRISSEQPVVLIEKDVHIFSSALNYIDLTDILRRPNLFIHIGGPVSKAVQFISRVQLDTGAQRISMASHIPSLKTFPEFYRSIIQTVDIANKVNIFDKLRYRKFNRTTVNVLLLTTQYFLMGEVITACKRLGISFRLITIAQEECGTDEFITELIKCILDFKPDFLMTINHLGVDREGVLSEFLQKIEMPLASWYVDNPKLIIRNYRKNINPFCTLFLWDKNSVADMNGLGFDHCHYLPLGVDENRFRPVDSASNPYAHLSAEVSFAGNSMVSKVKKCFEKSNVPKSLNALFHAISMTYMASPERSIEALIQTDYPQLSELYAQVPDIDLSHFETAISWEATRIYRLERVLHLQPFNPLIIGDDGWKELLEPGRFRYHKELSYYEDLHYLYNITSINFNATSRQMKGAVNQRVFDVPACRQFLLTDFQSQAAELFEIGQELVCYDDPEEIGDLVRFYLTHPNLRHKIADRGYERVLKDHTYRTRISRLIDIMRKTYR